MTQPWNKVITARLTIEGDGCKRNTQEVSPASHLDTGAERDPLLLPVRHNSETHAKNRNICKTHMSNIENKNTTNDNQMAVSFHNENVTHSKKVKNTSINKKC